MNIPEKLSQIGDIIETDSTGTGLASGDVLLYVGRADLTGEIRPRDCVIGDDGSAVRVAQTLLSIIGYSVVIDGIFGAETKKAVSDFQIKNQIPVNNKGTIGMKTWTKLMEVIQ